MADQTSSTGAVQEDGSPDHLAIDTIRTISMDAVQNANSGWKNFVRYDPTTPDSPKRDRFVLSVGRKLIEKNA